MNQIDLWTQPSNIDNEEEETLGVDSSNLSDEDVYEDEWHGIDQDDSDEESIKDVEEQQAGPSEPKSTPKG